MRFHIFDGAPIYALALAFGMTGAPLEPLPLSCEYIPSLIVMARLSSRAAATPTPTAAVPRTMTPKTRPKPGAREPQERLSWLRLPRRRS